MIVICEYDCSKSTRGRKARSGRKLLIVIYVICISPQVFSAELTCYFELQSMPIYRHESYKFDHDVKNYNT
jgi:hypothetical protein